MAFERMQGLWYPKPMDYLNGEWKMFYLGLGQWGCADQKKVMSTEDHMKGLA